MRLTQVDADALIGRLHSAGKGALTEVMERFSEIERAELSAHCYARSHLRDIGILIACSCSQEILIFRHRGLGEELFRLSREYRSGPETEPAKRQGSRSKITLASSSYRSFPPPEDLESLSAEAAAA